MVREPQEAPKPAPVEEELIHQHPRECRVFFGGLVTFAVLLFVVGLLA